MYVACSIKSLLWLDHTTGQIWPVFFYGPPTIRAMSQDNDASYKLLFSSPELVRDLVLGFIPDEWLHSLDYSTLEKMPGSYVIGCIENIPISGIVWL